MKDRIFLLLLLLTAVLFSCGEPSDTPRETPSEEQVIVHTIPDSPLEVGLRFSNALGMNDRECFSYLEPGYRETVEGQDLSPWEIFGRWRGFDPGGRLSATTLGPDSLNRTSYFCTIARLEELPPVVRMDFVLIDGCWFIENIETRQPGDVIDSLSIENQAALVLSNRIIRREMRIARMLLDDCALDHETHWASWYAASDAGSSFAEYIMELSPESYSSLALSNVRVSAKLQLIQNRATFQITDVPLELRGLIAAWRELAYLKKAILRATHEAMQNLRQTGTWIPPEIEEEEARIAFLENVFYSVSDIVEERDSLSARYAVVLTSGHSEPLDNLLVELDPHQLEQKVENDIGIPVWRALGVDMNGDLDPERVVYWAGDIYLFLGTPTGYRLVWRSWMDFESDFHSQFGTQSSPSGNRSVVLVGNEGAWEYELSLDAISNPVFTRTGIGSDSAGVDEDLLMDSPLRQGDPD